MSVIFLKKQKLAKACSVMGNPDRGSWEEMCKCVCLLPSYGPLHLFLLQRSVSWISTTVPKWHSHMVLKTWADARWLLTVLSIRCANLCSSLPFLCPFREGLLMETLVHSGGEGSRWVAVSSRSQLPLCIPLPSWSPVGSPCCESAAYPSCCSAREKQWLNGTAPLEGLLPCMRPAAQARAASGWSRSGQGRWHSLNLGEAADRLAQPHLDILSGYLGKVCSWTWSALNTWCGVFELRVYPGYLPGPEVRNRTAFTTVGALSKCIGAGWDPAAQSSMFAQSSNMLSWHRDWNTRAGRGHGYRLGEDSPVTSSSFCSVALLPSVLLIKLIY